jgi:serine/threonine-protein kinase
MAHAREYALKAIAIDESVAEAHASLAWTLFIHDWDWAGAAREFRRAIELDPRYPSAHQWFSFLLLTAGRFEEALIHVRTALELDPASVSIRRSVGWAHYYARRFDEARYHLTRAIAMNPTAEETYRILGITLAATAHWAEAENAIRDGMALPGPKVPSTEAALGYVLARSGRRAEAEQLLASLEEQHRTGYVSAVVFATLHLGLDQLQPALDWMEQAYEERRGWMAYLKVNPIVDPLRGDPRFEALVRKMRL